VTGGNKNHRVREVLIDRYRIFLSADRDKDSPANMTVSTDQTRPSLYLWAP